MTSGLARDLALLIARIGLGVVFVAHGWQKLNTTGLDATKTGFDAMGVPVPDLSAYFATFVELVGGAALILGVLTPIAGLLLFVNMLGAFFVAHIDKGLFVSDGGYELVVALGCGALVLAAVGPGRFAADSLFRSGGRTARVTR
jgi:putative oxidoreductase